MIALFPETWAHVAALLLRQFPWVAHLLGRITAVAETIMVMAGMILAVTEMVQAVAVEITEAGTTTIALIIFLLVPVTEGEAVSTVSRQTVAGMAAEGMTVAAKTILTVMIVAVIIIEGMNTSETMDALDTTRRDQNRAGAKIAMEVNPKSACGDQMRRLPLLLPPTRVVGSLNEGQVRVAMGLQECMATITTWLPIQAPVWQECISTTPLLLL